METSSCELFQQAQTLFSKGNLKDAKEKFSQVLGRCRPPDGMAAETSFNLWQIACEEGDSEAAKREVTYLCRHYKDSEWVKKLSTMQRLTE